VGIITEICDNEPDLERSRVIPIGYEVASYIGDSRESLAIPVGSSSTIIDRILANTTTGGEKR
jgi:hypothetical protein